MMVLLDHLGLEPRHVMAIGDGLNDLELVTNAGFGVAMANAVPQVGPTPLPPQIHTHTHINPHVLPFLPPSLVFFRKKVPSFYTLPPCTRTNTPCAHTAGETFP